jgi:short-subunit dehydrogenase involved in D-alanine esterification of teichoic acids
MSFGGKIALVTGGGSGIGLALAHRLHAAGARVIVCGRRGKRLDDACAGHPGMRRFACDIASADGVLRLEAYLRGETGGLDLLFNNAGVQTQDDLTSPATGFKAIDVEIRTNLVAPIMLTQRLLPMMAGRPGAAIVNVVSLLAVMAKPSAPVYCATKAGLLQFSRAMELVLGDAGVRMVAAFPPLVDTAMTHGRGANKMSSDACAAELLRQLAGGAREIRIGQARGQLALHRFLPSLAAVVTRRRSAGQTLPESGDAPTVPIARTPEGVAPQNFGG